MANEFEFINTEGSAERVTAENSAGAFTASEGRRASDSGVRAIDTTSLRDQPPVQLPETQPEIKANALQANLSTSVASNRAKLDADKLTADTEAEIIRKTQEFESFVTGQETESEITGRIGEEQGLQPKQEARDKALTAFEDEERALELQIRALEKNPEGRETAGVEASIRQARSASLQKQADLAIVFNALNRDFDTARAFVEQKVTAKFERQELEINAKRETMNALTGLLTKKEQRSFDASLRAEQREVDTQKADMLIKNNLFVEVLEGGGSEELAAQVREADTIEEAIRLGGRFIGQAQRLQNALTSSKLRIAQSQEAQLQSDIDNGIIRLTEDQQDTAFKLISQFEDGSKEFVKQTDSINRVRTSAADPSAAGDLALIFNYMKMLDPNSVVRESEFKTAAEAGSFLDRTYGFGLKLSKGQRLSPNQRNDFLTRGNSLYSAAEEQHEQFVDQITTRADQFGVPAEAVVRDVASVSGNLDRYLDTVEETLGGGSDLQGTPFEIYMEGLGNFTPLTI